MGNLGLFSKEVWEADVDFSLHKCQTTLSPFLLTNTKVCTHVQVICFESTHPVTHEVLVANFSGTVGGELENICTYIAIE